MHSQTFPPLTDYLFKFLVIGNAGVGKSCLLHQFIEQKCKYNNYCILNMQSCVRDVLDLQNVKKPGILSHVSLGTQLILID